MATQKNRKSKNHKTVRRHRTSTSGKIQVPIDVRSNNDLPKFRKALKDKNLTIILVYATWCPHCHTLMPHFDAAAKSPNKTVTPVKINETMLDSVNNYIKKNVNASAKPISVNGYPSIILVNKNAEKITDIEPVRDTESLTKVMENAGTLAKNAGLNSVIGEEKKGMATMMTKNVDMGEEELKGSIVADNKNKNKNIKLNSVKTNSMIGKKNNSKMNIAEATAPSPINTITSIEESVPIKNSSKKAMNTPKESEAEEIISLQATIPPGTPSVEIKPVSPPLPSNSVRELEPAEKIAGGGSCRRGGSLMSALSRTTYTLAPAAVLLATAATIMKGNKRTSKKQRRSTKKTRKSRAARR